MSTSLPVFLHHLIDDAAIFPPGNADVSDAVAAHLDRALPKRDAVGPFVVDDARAGAAGDAAAAHGAVIDIALVVRSATAALPALEHAAAHPHLRTVALEASVSPSDGDLDHALAGIERAVTDAAERPAVWIELSPLPTDPAPALTALGRAGYGMKIRTGGLTADAFPPPETLAHLLVEAARLSVPIKCTAGLHHAVRHPDAALGIDRHGFLNILLAAARARAGASHAEVSVILSSDQESILVSAMGMIGADEMAAARRFFRSYGSCSIDEPLAEIVRLGLADERITS